LATEGTSVFAKATPDKEHAEILDTDPPSLKLPTFGEVSLKSGWRDRLRHELFLTTKLAENAEI